MQEEMIRDCLVVGIKDKSLSERLQMESDLTLDKAKTFVRQRETVQQQQGILKSNSEVLETLNINHKKRTGRPQQRRVPNPSQTKTRQPVPIQERLFKR